MDLTNSQLQKLAGIIVNTGGYGIQLGALLVAYKNIYPFKTSEKARQIVEYWRNDPEILKESERFLANYEEAKGLLYKDLQGLAFQVMAALDANPDVILNLTERKFAGFKVLSDAHYNNKLGNGSLAKAMILTDGCSTIFARASNLNMLHPYKQEVVRGGWVELGSNAIIHEALHISDWDDKHRRFGLMSNSALFMHAFNIGSSAGSFSEDKTVGFRGMILGNRSYNAEELYHECLSYYAETYYAGQFAEGCIGQEELSKPFKIFFDHIVNYGLSLSRAEDPKLALKIFTEHMMMDITEYNELCKKHGLPENLDAVSYEDLVAAGTDPQKRDAITAKFHDYCNKYEKMCKDLVRNIKQEVEDKTKLAAQRQESKIGGKWQQYIASQMPPVREL